MRAIPKWVEKIHEQGNKSDQSRLVLLFSFIINGRVGSASNKNSLGILTSVLIQFCKFEQVMIQIV